MKFLLISICSLFAINCFAGSYSYNTHAGGCFALDSSGYEMSRVDDSFCASGEYNYNTHADGCFALDSLGYEMSRVDDFYCM